MPIKFYVKYKTSIILWENQMFILMKIYLIFGRASFVYNNFIDMRINLYKYTKTGMNYNEMSFVLTNYVKSEFLFLKEVDKFALEGSLRNLDYAHTVFKRM